MSDLINVERINFFGPNRPVEGGTVYVTPPLTLTVKIGELIAELHVLKTRAAELEEENEGLRAKTDNRKKLREFEVFQIRKLAANGMSQREIADHYAINAATVSRIVRKVYH